MPYDIARALQNPDIIGNALAAGQAGRAAGLQDQAMQKQNALAQLAGQAYAAPAAQQNALVSQMVGIDPQAGMAMGNALTGRAQAQEVDHAKRLGGAARYMAQALQSKNPAQIEGAWQAVRPYLAQVSGKEPPQQWDPAMEPALYQAIAATGGAPEQKGVVLSAGGQLRNPMTGELLADNPQSLQYHDVPMGEGRAAGVFDPSTGTVRPAVGGAAQGGPQIDPMQTFIDQANAAIKMGAPQDQVEAWLQQQARQIGAQPQVPGQPGQPGQGGNQLQTTQAVAPAQFGVGTPKASAAPDSFRNATPDELKQYGLPEGAVAQVNTKTGKLDVISKPATLSADKLADVAVKRQKVEQAKQESVATFNDSINKIDTLLNDPSFSALGTFTGDIAAKIPHTDTANARSMLDTISAQSVINVLSSLKSLSANGASGFGALSEKEGEILRNAAANLSTSQSNSAIRQNLIDLKQKLARSRDRISSQEINLPEDSVGKQGPQPAQGGWAIQRVN